MKKLTAKAPLVTCILVNILFLLLPDTSPAIGNNSINSYRDSQTKALNQANLALQIVLAQCSAYYTKHGYTAPENTFEKDVSKSSMFKQISNDKYCSSFVKFDDKNAPACIQNKTVKLVPKYSLDDEGNYQVDYGNAQCYTDIDSGGDQDSCSPIPLQSSTANYFTSPTALGSNLTNCKTVDSSIIGETRKSSDSNQPVVPSGDDWTTEDSINSGSGTGTSPLVMQQNADETTDEDTGGTDGTSGSSGSSSSSDTQQIAT